MRFPASLIQACAGYLSKVYDRRKALGFPKISNSQIRCSLYLYMQS